MSNPFNLEPDFFSATSKNGFAASSKILSDEHELILEDLTPQINSFFHHRELQNNLKISGTITCDNIIAKNLSTIDQETGNITNNITVNSVENSTQFFRADQGHFTSLDTSRITAQTVDVKGSLITTEAQKNNIVANAADTVQFKGNAATATKLATPINVGGVSFDGTIDINLPGVNTPGNQDTTGNAATASAAKEDSALEMLLIQIQGNIADLVTRVTALENP